VSGTAVRAASGTARVGVASDVVAVVARAAIGNTAATAADSCPGRFHARSPYRVPFKSKAQRRKFAELLVKGEITPEQFEEWNRETGSAELPERVKPKKRAAARKRKTRAGRAKRERSRKAPTRR
jgi:hypothetical protein